MDDFRVGERIWVNGNKPGFIQFLGETQFAPGQWAGIVLDEAIGKNDGSVAGVRYFQCEPLRGIFTRPSKLARKAMPEDEANGTQASRATSPTSVASLVSSPSAAAHLPPTGIPQKTPVSQASNLSKTPSESISNLSEAGSLKKGERELKMGDRVLVSCRVSWERRRDVKLPSQLSEGQAGERVENVLDFVYLKYLCVYREGKLKRRTCRTGFLNLSIF